jgi:methionyl-tRNA formyltransferase
MLISALSLCLRAMRDELAFAYLNFKNHPRGLIMLQALLDAGFRPSLVIEEDSPAANEGAREQRQVLKKLPDYDDSGDVEALCRAHGVPYRSVADHNAPECAELIRALPIQLAILGDTRILKEGIISACNLGVINVHPGVLPELRGNNPYVWAVLEGKVQGVTVHFIDRGVDTGPILLKRILERVPPSYPQLIRSINTLCGEALVEALRRMRGGALDLVLQPVQDTPARKAASAELKQIAAEKLRERLSEIDALTR